MTDEIPHPTKEQIHKILEYLPYFQDAKNIFFEYVPLREVGPGITHFPYYIYSVGVSDFLKCLEDHKFIINPYDHKSVRKYFGLIKGEIDPSNLTVYDIRHIFSFLLNADRFCQGQIARAIEKGIFLKMLQRLNGLSEEIQIPLDYSLK
ncbi:MAG: hypothetical protein AMQ22_00434 [Candidatus Methanofastidiosum methylothiophilum]|uniref:Uncharacterized protein n=1 Tax=Candidatus Methanofastidiosum methylothiophilum TaxID=1705564 RepID=A0A150J7D2_9EURY|nr:MAG: hypothetical protein AMQ22_00434 [Candidatus Methanofastidiosum methylthiophilus]